VGLLINLLTFPLAPVRGVVWVAEQIAEATDREVLGEEGLRQHIEARSKTLNSRPPMRSSSNGCWRPTTTQSQPRRNDSWPLH